MLSSRPESLPRCKRRCALPVNNSAWLLMAVQPTLSAIDGMMASTDTGEGTNVSQWPALQCRRDPAGAPVQDQAPRAFRLQHHKAGRGPPFLRRPPRLHDLRQGRFLARAVVPE